MTKKATAPSRKKLLTAAIKTQYLDLNPTDIHQIESLYEDSIMEMFEVMDVSKTSVELMHFFNDVVYSPVIIDEEVRRHLKREDVFLMCLGLKKEKWYVIYMTPPYESFPY